MISFLFGWFDWLCWVGFGNVFRAIRGGFASCRRYGSVNIYQYGEKYKTVLSFLTLFRLFFPPRFFVFPGPAAAFALSYVLYLSKCRILFSSFPNIERLVVTSIALLVA